MLCQHTTTWYILPALQCRGTDGWYDCGTYLFCQVTQHIHFNLAVCCRWQSSSIHSVPHCHHKDSSKAPPTLHACKGA